MVRNNTIGGINAIHILSAKLSTIRTNTSQLLDLGENGSEDVGIVIAALVLDDGHKTLETHPGVDML